LAGEKGSLGGKCNCSGLILFSVFNDHYASIGTVPALDVFRGMTICFMIIVNTPGDYTTTFSPLLICWWVGWWLDKRKIYIRV
jgi:hypothetical protein